jgi:hypothetical protein
LSFGPNMVVHNMQIDDLFKEVYEVEAYSKKVNEQFIKNGASN